MAEDEAGEGSQPDAKKKEPADQKRREQILVAAGLGGLLLTFLLLRRSSSSSAAPAPQYAYPPGSAASPGSYSGGVASSDFYSLEAQVQGLSQELSTLQNASGSSSPTAISTTPAASLYYYGSGYGPQAPGGGPITTIANWTPQQLATAEAPVVGDTGGSYVWAPPGSVNPGPIFLQPEPGHFVPAGPTPYPAAQYIRSA